MPGFLEKLVGIFSKRPVHVLCFIQLPQDLDLVLPVLIALKSKGIQTRTLVSRETLIESPRISAALSEGGFDFFSLPRRAIRHGRLPRLNKVGAIFCATESSAGPHRIAHELAKRANRLDIPTFTSQHGFDNIGLTYFDKEYPPEKIEFASQHILLWGSQETLHPQVSESTKTRCLTVGFPKPPVTSPLRPLDSRQCVVVFENLHWSRYSEAFRIHFVTDVLRLAKANPKIRFILKPHHAGRWATTKATLSVENLENFEIADPLDRKWEPYTAPALLGLADAVITTPSTVALDAVRIKCPVAIAAYDLELERYAPLPLLRRYEDYEQFLLNSRPENEEKMLELNDAFQKKYVSYPDGDIRIAYLLSQALQSTSKENRWA